MDAHGVECNVIANEEELASQASFIPEEYTMHDGDSYENDKNSEFETMCMNDQKKQFYRDMFDKLQLQVSFKENSSWYHVDEEEAKEGSSEQFCYACQQRKIHNGNNNWHIFDLFQPCRLHNYFCDVCLIIQFQETTSDGQVIYQDKPLYVNKVAKCGVCREAYILHQRLFRLHTTIQQHVLEIQVVQFGNVTNMGGYDYVRYRNSFVDKNQIQAAHSIETQFLGQIPSISRDFVIVSHKLRHYMQNPAREQALLFEIWEQFYTDFKTLMVYHIRFQEQISDGHDILSSQLFHAIAQFYVRFLIEQYMTYYKCMINNSGFCLRIVSRFYNKLNKQFHKYQLYVYFLTYLEYMALQNYTQNEDETRLQGVRVELQMKQRELNAMIQHFKIFMYDPMCRNYISLDKYLMKNRSWEQYNNRYKDKQRYVRVKNVVQHKDQVPTNCMFSYSGRCMQTHIYSMQAHQKLFGMDIVWEGFSQNHQILCTLQQNYHMIDCCKDGMLINFGDYSVFGWKHGMDEDPDKRCENGCERVFYLRQY